MLDKKIFIVEDDPIIASDLKAILEDLNYTISGIAHEPFDAKKRIESNLPDLILMDVNLNSPIDGIDLAVLLKKMGAPIIFITAFTDKETVDRVKEVVPVGYIIKPFNDKEIEIALELAFHKVKSDVVVEENKNDFVFIKTKNNLSLKVYFNELLYIEAFDNYSFIHTLKEKHIVSFTLKELEHKLNSSTLIRVHRSYIVNKEKIDGIQYNNLLIGTHEIPIGKSYKEQILHLFPVL